MCLIGLVAVTEFTEFTVFDAWLQLVQFHSIRCLVLVPRSFIASILSVMFVPRLAEESPLSIVQDLQAVSRKMGSLPLGLFEWSPCNQN